MGNFDRHLATFYWSHWLAAIHSYKLNLKSNQIERSFHSPKWIGPFLKILRDGNNRQENPDLKDFSYFDLKGKNVVVVLVVSVNAFYIPLIRVQIPPEANFDFLKNKQNELSWLITHMWNIFIKFVPTVFSLKLRCE